MKTHNSKKMPKIYTTDALEIVTLSWPEVATEVWGGSRQPLTGVLLF